MSIRRRLLILAIGGALPLLLLGLAFLLSVWRAKEKQLNEGLEQQAELAAVVFEHWLDGQTQPIRTIAAEYDADPASNANLRAQLRAAMRPRNYWRDVGILDRAGRVVVNEPANADVLPPVLAEKLIEEARESPLAVETDWTKGDAHYQLVLATPTTTGGVVIARIDGESLKELFQGVSLPERSLITLVDQEHRIVYRSQIPESALGLAVSDPRVLSALDNRNTAVVTVRSSVDGVDRVYGLARVSSTGYITTVGVPSTILYAAAWRQFVGYGLVVLLVVFATSAAALLIARSIARPVRLLNFAAEQFGSGDFSTRAPSSGDDELSSLALSLNVMAEQIEKREARLAELDNLKSEFVSSVSHELRTPLTTIKALTRLLLRNGLSDDKRREYLETISVECDRQIDLVLNLLDLSRLEGGVLRITHERVDVSEVISSCITWETRAAKKRGHELRVEPLGELSAVCADPKALHRALSNIIENAIKYTPDGGRIVLAARQADETVEISVTDNGPGIPAEDIPVLFDKFHRGRPVSHSASINPAESDAELLEDADVSGVGLGLYLVRNVMARMGGRILVESKVGRGSTFSLHLPLWRPGGCNGGAETIEE